MLSAHPTIRYRIATILAAHWGPFVARHERWIRPAVFENVSKVLHCRTAALGCHLYRCPGCGQYERIPHSCKSRFCPVCGKHATDVWSARALSRLLDVPYHHLILSLPWQLRIVIAMNRCKGLNLLFDAAAESVQQWARDVKAMRMGMLMVMHTFGSDLCGDRGLWTMDHGLARSSGARFCWSIVHGPWSMVGSVTGGGLSLDGSRWIATDPRFLMHHSGRKKRWKYHVLTRMKKAHRQGHWRFPERLEFLRKYPCFGSMLNKLWNVVWYAHIGASLLDPRFSVRYIGRYTKRAVLAEYRITFYDGKHVRFRIKDYAEGGKTAYRTVPVLAFVGRLIRHIPDKHFPMIRYRGIFCNRWKHRYLAQAREALARSTTRSPEPETVVPVPTWAERQTAWRGCNPLICPVCGLQLQLVGVFFGSWSRLEQIFRLAGSDRTVPTVRLSPG